MNELPTKIREACESKRDQAKRFLDDFIHRTPAPATRKRSTPSKSKTIAASWSDISLIYEFFQM